MNYQGDTVEDGPIGEKLDTPKSFNFITPLLAVGVASLAIAGLKYNFDSSNYRSTLTEFRQKDLDESMIAAASREAMIKRISQLPTSYIPAANYFDPCDTYATRKECCSDPAYPVLGGMDLVNYRLTGQVIFGDPKIAAEIQGISRTYKFWFADKTSVSIFESSPEVYLPMWGGFDATEFCTSGGPDMQTLIAKTVDLSKNVEIDRHISFAALTADETKACGRSFSSLYGTPVNGIFNTRCVSMSNFQNPTVGLALDMPLNALPVKMSELYGVPPGLPAGLLTKGNDLSADTNPQPLDQVVDGSLSAVQATELHTSDLNQPDFPATFDSKIPPLAVKNVHPAGPTLPIQLPSFNVNPAKSFEEVNHPAPLTLAMPQATQNDQAIQNSFSNSEKPVGEKAMLKRGLIDPSQVSAGLLDQLSNDPMGDTTLSIEQSFPNSVKPVGEKAMLKRGLVDPSQVSDGILDQLSNEPLGEKAMLKRGLIDPSQARDSTISQLFQMP